MRWLFIIVAVFLPLQFAYAYLVDEPWPAFVLPGFAGTPDRQCTVEWLEPRLTVLFAHGPVDVSSARLFSKTPLPPYDAMVRVFAPSDTQLPGTVYGLFKDYFLKQPAIPSGAAAPFSRAQDPHLRDWLLGRLADLYPGQAPRRLEVRWQRHHVAVCGRLGHDTSTTVSSVSLPL
ncbi:MAG: hypothetical protein E6J14_11685 [Chloroflexi bacterium]|nr:MAG: hypothetical protein E6J14_11685 [Chloroflexota bacterium]